MVNKFTLHLPPLQGSRGQDGVGGPPRKLHSTQATCPAQVRVPSVPGAVRCAGLLLLCDAHGTARMTAPVIHMYKGSRWPGRVGQPCPSLVHGGWQFRLWKTALETSHYLLDAATTPQTSWLPMVTGTPKMAWNVLGMFL